MKRLAICITLLTIAVAAPVFGAACVTGTVASYQALNGSGGCTIGDKIFSNFSFAASAGGGSSVLAASSITVTPVTNGGTSGTEIGLQFNSLWSAGSNSFSDTTITFEVQVIGGGGFMIDDASTVQSSSGFTGTGQASVTEGICGPAPCTNTSTSTTTIKEQGTTQLSDHITFTPTGSIMAVKDIGVQGGTNGTATISQVTDTFSQTSVPEPASVFLLGGAMVGLCTLVRRRQTRKA